MILDLRDTPRFEAEGREEAVNAFKRHSAPRRVASAAEVSGSSPPLAMQLNSLGRRGALEGGLSAPQRRHDRDQQQAGGAPLAALRQAATGPRKPRQVALVASRGCAGADQWQERIIK